MKLSVQKKVSKFGEDGDKIPTVELLGGDDPEHNFNDTQHFLQTLYPQKEYI